MEYKFMQWASKFVNADDIVSIALNKYILR